MFNSLKFKIIVMAILIISTIQVTAMMRDIKTTEEKLLTGQMEKARLFSESVKHGIMVLMLKNRWQDLQSMMKNIVSNAGELRKLSIFLPENGIIVVSSEEGDIGRKILDEDLQRYREDKESASFLVEHNGERLASKFTEIPNQPACHRCHGSTRAVLGVLDLEISLAEVSKDIDEFENKRLKDGLVGFTLVIGSFLLIFGLMIDRPITKMTRTIRRIEEGDLSARMDDGKNDELGHMAKSFNSMVESLEKANRKIEKYHEEQMQRAAKLASIGEVASGIAHEIKNPLTGISCAVQMLQSDLKEDDSRRETTMEILSNIKRLDRIVQNLLNYAKPKIPRFLPYRIDNILDKANFFVYPRAKKQGIEIETDICDEIPAVLMDADQMQQVFLNLMINALQEMHAGGKLRISICTAKYDDIKGRLRRPMDTEEVLIVSFADTGSGINPEDISNLFEPFFTKKTQGTGLGLSISSGIIKTHKGEIGVESELGKGSVFTIYLPVKTNEE